MCWKSIYRFTVYYIGSCLSNVGCGHMMVVPGRDGRSGLAGSMANGQHMVGVSCSLDHVTANAEVQAATGAVAGHPTAGLDTVT